MKRKKGDSRLVYSTESGKVGLKSKKSTKCKFNQFNPPRDGIVRLMRQTKGRKGKGVTLINGLELDTAALKKLAKSLKQKCGSGGSVKNGVIEIQGDHRDVLHEELTNCGYTVKLAGG